MMANENEDVAHPFTTDLLRKELEAQALGCSALITQTAPRFFMPHIALVLQKTPGQKYEKLHRVLIQPQGSEQWNKDKEAAVSLIALAAYARHSEEKPLLMSVIAEAWVVKAECDEEADLKEVIKNIKPSLHKDKKKMLVITCGVSDGRAIMAMAELKIDSNGNRVGVGDWQFEFGAEGEEIVSKHNPLGEAFFKQWEHCKEVGLTPEQKQEIIEHSQGRQPDEAQQQTGDIFAPVKAGKNRIFKK